MYSWQAKNQLKAILGLLISKKKKKAEVNSQHQKVIYTP